MCFLIVPDIVKAILYSLPIARDLRRPVEEETTEDVSLLGTGLRPKDFRALFFLCVAKCPLD